MKERTKSWVEAFCTPESIDLTNFDLKSISTARQVHIDFEGLQIPVYSWGEGKKILLVHGWSSRASHMALLARILSHAGFNVFAFDAPAHSSKDIVPSKSTSNMFEFGRSVSEVAKHLGDVHALVAHSLGAIATTFALTGYNKFNGHQFDSKKLVSISSPSSVEEVISSFSKTHNLILSERNALIHDLELEFDFKVADYTVERALEDSTTELLVIHDEDDDNVPISNAYNFKDTISKSNLVITKGLGHKKILFNRDTIKTIEKFISE